MLSTACVTSAVSACARCAPSGPRSPPGATSSAQSPLATPPTSCSSGSIQTSSSGTSTKPSSSTSPFSAGMSSMSSRIIYGSSGRNEEEVSPSSISMFGELTTSALWRTGTRATRWVAPSSSTASGSSWAYTLTLCSWWLVMTWPGVARTFSMSGSSSPGYWAPPTPPSRTSCWWLRPTTPSTTTGALPSGALPWLAEGPWWQTATAPGSTPSSPPSRNPRHQDGH